MVGMLVWIGLGCWLVSAIIYAIGVITGITKVKIYGEGGIVGVLIYLITLIIVSIFEIGLWGIPIFLLSALIFIPVYRNAGIQAIYMVAIFALVIGYVFAGPYSGFAKSYVTPLAAPIGLAWDQLTLTVGDIFLMATDPQAYLAKQALSNVKTEKATVDYPKGLEFKKVTSLPADLPSDQKFYVQVYAQNDGEMTAVNAMISASCASKVCCVGDICDTSESTTYYYPGKNEPTTIKQHEVMLQNIGPFMARATRTKDIGKTADVNVTLHYSHSTSSSLKLTVMNENEVKRIVTDSLQSDELFKTVPSVGKNSPGMVALTVGYQPLFNNKNETLIVSVVNKRPRGSIILSKGAQLNISLPIKLGFDLQCNSDQKVTCSGDGQNVICNFIEDMDPITPIIKYRPFTCTFHTTESVETKVTDIITARLSGYTFEQTQTVGPRITLSYKPLASGSVTTTTTGNGMGVITTTSGGGIISTTTVTTVTCPTTCNYDYANTLRYIKPLSDAEKTAADVYVCNDNTNCGCTLSDHPDGCLN